MARKWAVALAATTLVSQLAVAGPPAQASRRNVLAGRSLISGSTSTMAHVVLPRTVRIPNRIFGSHVLEIESEGRIAGAVLKEDVPKGGAELISLSLGLCAKAPCKEKPARQSLFYDPDQRLGAKTATLPAGRYLLFLIADGTPTDVRLNLPGLSGTSVLHPDATPDVDLGELQADVPAPGAAPVYSGRRSASIHDMGFSMAALELKADANVVDDMGSCYEEQGVATSNPAFCQGGGGGWTFFNEKLDGGRVILVGLGLVGRGDFTHSVYMRALGSVQEVATMGLTVDYGAGHRVGGLSSESFFADHP